MDDRKNKTDLVPMVSISCITYNHAPYIRECLDGFMMQKTNFAFEVLIHDDASTDGTADIIREYEAKYPDIIKPIYQTENQYSKGISPSASFNFPRAKGKYIALCEGDDYWTDPLKLQKQVDFLESHPDYVMCSHRFKQYIQDEHRFIKDWYTDKYNYIDYDWNSFVKFEYWYAQTLSILFRRKALDLSLYAKYKIQRDLILIYNLLKSGKGCLFSDVMAVYRKHSTGIWTGNNLAQNRTSDIKACICLYDTERTPNSAIMLFNRLNGCKYVGLRYFVKNYKLLIKAFVIIVKCFGLKAGVCVFYKMMNFINK